MALGKKVKASSDGNEDDAPSTDDEDVADGLEESNEEEIEQRKEEPIRHSARSRNRKINEESFKRLRDLSISCQ